jgi:transposase
MLLILENKKGGGSMNEDCRQLQRQVNHLHERVEMLQSIVSDNRKEMTEIIEISDFLEKLMVFMLRVLQGHFPFDILVEHVGHKVEKKELRKLYDGAVNLPRHLSRRALTILYSIYGIGDKPIMDFLYISRNTVKRYKRKFKEGGVDNLFDTRKKAIKIADDPKLKEILISLLHSPPKDYGYNRTSWTLKLLRQEMANQGYPICRNNVSLIIKKSGYRFWKAKEVLTSNDPKYRKKLEKIKTILSNLKPSERFFSIDEFGPFAVKERGGRRLVLKSKYPTVPQFQQSKGSLIVTAALELATNQVTHFYSPRKNSDEIMKMLHILIEKYYGYSSIYLSWDHASWHSSKVLFSEIEKVNEPKFRRLSDTPLVKVAPLPARAQFLNVIESVFSGMAAAIIQNSDYESVDEAREAIDRYFWERNEHFLENPRRAGNKIWGKEIVAPVFKEGQNCKNRKWR